MQPLEGIRIADFSHIMAGPYATHLLRLLGAEVIKVEAPGRGDPMRYYGSDRAYDGMAPAFIAVNAGKKSISLDLKKPASLEAAKRLIARSDVVVENFRPGVMTRLGLGFPTVHALNAGIIYCSVSGYGQSGPLRDWPAIDNIVQATSGMMSLGGEPGDPPMRVGFPVVDTLTGQTAAFAILAALFRRQRTGQGEFIDVAMLDASLSFMASAVVPFLVTGRAVERTGNTGYSGQPTAAMFEAGDGKLVSLGVVQQAQFEALARLLEQMSAAGIPCGMVRDVAAAAALPHLRDRGMRIPLHIPGLPQDEQVDIVNAGFRFQEGGPMVSEPPPTHGQDTEEVLKWLDFDEPQRREISKDA